MKIKHYILFALLLWANLLIAQDTKFTASVSKAQVGAGEQFEVTFSINGRSDSFAPPAFSGFEVLSGPNESTSMASINGSTTINTSYSYVLMAAKMGSYTIGPATLIVSGHRMNTNPIKITVVKGQPVQQNSRGQSTPDDVAEGNPVNLGKSIFMRAVVDKNNVYQGQQLIVNYRLYTRVNIEESQPDKLPDLNGFWSEDVKQKAPQQPAQWKIENYKGLQYHVTDLKESILFPEHAGDLTIDPLGVTFIIKQPVPSHDIMDQFFGGAFKDVKVKVKSPPVIIHAKPLPESGKPDSFTGAVGSFNIEASIDKTDVKANDALNFKVKVTGAGNIKLFKPLNASFPADFEKYDPKTTDTVSESESGVSGSRIYNYLLIPRHQGDYTIDPIKFSYFNPATGRYATVSTKAFHIKVAKGNNESNVTSFSNDKQDVKLLDKDIRYIKAGAENATKESYTFYGSAGYWLLLIIGPVLCFIAFMYRNWLRKTNSDLVKVKSRKAGRIAAKHLANAQQQLSANNTQAFYEDIFKGLYGYLSDKLNISYANLDRETIASALRNKALDERVIGELLNTLDLCEMARYAPVKHISTNEVFEKAKDIINDIESKI